MVVEGDSLELNADAQAGRLVVEVLAPDSQPIPMFSFEDARPLQAVDGVRLRHRWKDQAELATLRGKSVRLKFHLEGAKLYALQVTS